MIGISYLKKTRDTVSSFFLTDKNYAKKRLKSIFGRDLNLKHPVDFYCFPQDLGVPGTPPLIDYAGNENPVQTNCTRVPMTNGL